MAQIARRRTQQPGSGVLLLILRHIKFEQGFFAAEPADRQRPGKSSVGRGFSVGYLAQQPPYPLPELPADGAQGQFGGHRLFSSKIPGQPVPRRVKDGKPVPLLQRLPHGSAEILLSLQPKADQVLPIAAQREHPQRGWADRRIVHPIPPF